MVCVLKERREERRQYILEKFERMFNPSPPIRTEELDFIVNKHPKYNAIGNQENSIGLYSQRMQMKSLVAKGAARQKF
eukprot:3342097-Ditylum_brightwellii.AAC.1